MYNCAAYQLAAHLFYHQHNHKLAVRPVGWGGAGSGPSDVWPPPPACLRMNDAGGGLLQATEELPSAAGPYDKALCLSFWCSGRGWCVPLRRRDAGLHR